MAHVLLRLWKISEFLESWLVIDKPTRGHKMPQNRLQSAYIQPATNYRHKCNKIGYYRRTYNQQPTIGHKCNEIGYNRRA